MMASHFQFRCFFFLVRVANIVIDTSEISAKSSSNDIAAQYQR
jgi:hypothetical protein